MKKKFLILLLLFSSFLFPQDRTELIDDLLARYYEYGLLNGSVLIAEKGNILLEKGYGSANMEFDIPNNELTVHRIGSITKQFTAAIIMQLVEEGKVKLNEKMTVYLKNYRKDTGDRITVHNLLTHTSGIPSYTGYPGFWSDSSRNPHSLDELITKFCSGDLEFEPGERFVYSNSGYVLLAKIIEEVTGDSYEINMRKRIFDKAGMNNSYLERPGLIIKNRASGYDKSGFDYANTRYFDVGNAIGAGDVASTVKDLYRWDQALYGDEIVNNDSKRKIFTAYLSNYGYGWMIDKIPGYSSGDSLLLYSHGGGINGFNSHIARIENEKQLIVILNNTGGAPLVEMRNKIFQILYDQNYSFPKKPIGRHMHEIISDEGVDKAVADYKILKVEEAENFIFAERELNLLGYQLMNENLTEEAIRIFGLNIEEYPDAFNTYDSMGEAYMIYGDTSKAIEYYKKSISLNSQNRNAYQKLMRLGVDIQEPKDAYVPETALAKYAGRYNLFPNFHIFISTENGNLFAQATGQAKFQIFPESETVFYYKVVQAKIEFVISAAGSVNKLILYQNNQEIIGNRIEE